MIKLDIESTNEQDIQLVNKYWEIDADGGFVGTVSSLLPFGDISNTSSLVNYINDVSTAKCLDISCSGCGDFKIVRSRSDFQTRNYAREFVCLDCLEKEKKALKELKFQEELELKKYLEESENRDSSKKMDYSRIPDADAILLMALDKAIAPRLAGQCFFVDQAESVAPGGAREIIKKLMAKGYLIRVPSKSKVGAYEIKEGVTYFFWDKVAFKLVSSVDSRDNSEILNGLYLREYLPSKEVYELWLDYAESDAMEYFYDKSGKNSLSTDDDDDLRLKSIIRESLKSLSVSQIWCALWKISEDAAALSTTKYYNLAKASKTIPGKLQRHLEKVRKGESILKQWARLDSQPGGSLGDIFYDYFGVDENSSGEEVFDALSPISEQKIDFDSDFEEKICFLMRKSIAFNLEAEVFHDFFKFSNQGFTFEESVQLTIDMHPSFNNIID
ncbi:hypothetical protein N5C67_03460 [Comamonas thiooxydans]|uniref:hypothetical protein n=1 Tax=Comamonas thiooxydans TaxID=363952 RepID=UPI00244B638F|nr:hypothetical protein [Comamonas thiooxydans]MDH1251704.1 hypothetical protein [Comamonas thiooxydans]